MLRDAFTRFCLNENIMIPIIMAANVRRWTFCKNLTVRYLLRRTTLFIDTFMLPTSYTHTELNI